MSLGSPLRRVDAEAKVTGQARYTDDMMMPGMLHACYVRSRIAHGKVTAIDTREAAAMPGVEAIFTCNRSQAHLSVVSEFRSCKIHTKSLLSL